MRLCTTFLTSLGMLAFRPALAVTSEDFAVKGLKEIEPAFAIFEGDMYAGLISIEKDAIIEDKDEGGKLMFWLFEPEAPKIDDSLVIWFNGGPGCSSFHAGLLQENGPATSTLHPAGYFGAHEDDPLVPNPYSWTNVTNMMYIEQPASTGFSYGPEPKDEDDVSRDLYNFLQNFYEVFPHQRSKRLYLVGESYAGMYVPAFAHKIYTENKKKHNREVNLAGIALGNGWADANIQAPMVIDYAWWHGMIDSVTRDAFHAEWEHCKLQNGSPEPPPFHPFTIPDECGIMGAVLKAAGAGLFPWGGPNTYDVTTWDPYPLLTSHNSTNVHFFNDPRVQEALNVPKDTKPWLGCIPGEGRRRRRLAASKKLLLDDDKPASMVPYLAELLDEAKIQVVVYNGDRDMSTCIQGSEAYLNSMEWSGKTDWFDPKAYRRGVWMVNGTVAGYGKVLKKLQLVMVYNSGHLVPFNQPVVALDLITRLLKDEDFCDEQIPVVFEPPKAWSDKSQTVFSDGSAKTGGFFVPAFLGFAAGVACVLAISAIRKKNKPQYEPLGDVEILEEERP